MLFDFPWYSLIYLAGTVLTLVLAVVIRRRQFAPGYLPFTYLMLCMAIWTLVLTLESGAVEVWAKILFAKIEYLAVISSGVLSLTFFLEYTRSTWIRRRRNFLLLWIFPVLSLALVWTNELHKLVWSRVYIDNNHPGVIGVWEHGPLYYLTPSYQYILYTVGIIILFRYALHRTPVYRRQVNLLLAGSLIPVAGTAIYLVWGNFVPGLELTPVSICIMAIIYAVSIFRYSFMDITPVASAALVKNLPDGYLVLDAEGQIADLNPAAERIIGYQKASLSGQRLTTFWPDLEKITSGNSSKQHIELVQNKAGTQFFLDINIESFFNKLGQVTGTLVVIRDVTALKQIQSKLEEEINKRTQFTRAVVHELRNPLTSIIASSDMLKDQVKENIQMALVNNILRAATNLEQKVNELFELARGNMGLLKINPVSLDMNQLIREIVAEMAPVAAKKEILLSYQSTGLPSTVWGDKNRLRQVLSNLIGNSIKYTSQGSIQVKTSQKNEDYLLVQVEDTGKGIEKEVLENLFDPYTRKTREKSGSTGLGIGLALSKVFVELHNGKIWAESTPGKGTTVSFIIPLFHPGTSEPELKHSPVQPDNHPPDHF